VWEFAAVYGVLLPLGLAVTGPVMASGVVARWFSARRGTALSLLGSASMTGMSLLVPLLTWLIVTTGWRMTYALIAAGVLAVIEGRDHPLDHANIHAWYCARLAAILGTAVRVALGPDEVRLDVEIGRLVD